LQSLNKFYVMGKNEKDSFWVVIYDKAFTEIKRFKYSKTKLILLIVFLLSFLFILDFFVVSYTPIKFLVPGYPTESIIVRMETDAVRMDSVMRELKMKNEYITNILKILKNDSLDNYVSEPVHDSSIDYKNVDMSLSKDDSLFRREMEQKAIFSSNVQVTTSNRTVDLYKINFYPPIKGVISNKYDPSKGHYGVDVVSKPNASVAAIESGVVIAAYWSLNVGYSIHIQHYNNVVSVYKHLTNVLVKQGDKVRSGQPIAFIGNTGELSSGTHLHFEMWYAGKCLDPTKYINFAN